MFSYVSRFFRENKINCSAVYSETPFEGFDERNEFGLEIYDSKKEKEDRFWQLSTGLPLPNNNPLALGFTSYAATRAQTVLTYGVHESNTGKSQEEINEALLELYKVDKEFLFRKWATHFSHEFLHCMSLFHPESIPGAIENTDLPNIMLRDTAAIILKPDKKHVLGYCLTPLQQKLIHSFIAGNNNYQAFMDSERELDIYLERVAEENNLSN